MKSEWLGVYADMSVGPFEFSDERVRESRQDYLDRGGSDGNWQIIADCDRLLIVSNGSRQFIYIHTSLLET